MKRRRLSDLYVTGKPLVIDDGTGDPIEVWLQKLNPVDHEAALRKAGAARARKMSEMRDKAGDMYLAIRSDFIEFTDEANIRELLTNYRLSDRYQAIEAEVSSDEQWSDDNYLQGLFDAWTDGLGEVYAKDPEDPEAKRVFSELERFNLVVTEKQNAEKAAIARDVADLTHDQAIEEATNLVCERQAGTAFMEEYETQQIYFAVREPDSHRKYYFGDHEEVIRLAPEVREQLLEAYRDLLLDPTEGKDLEETPDSSQPSELHAVPATGVSSGPEAATA